MVTHCRCHFQRAVSSHQPVQSPRWEESHSPGLCFDIMLHNKRTTRGRRGMKTALKTVQTTELSVAPLEGIKRKIGESLFCRDILNHTEIPRGSLDSTLKTTDLRPPCWFLWRKFGRQLFGWSLTEDVLAEELRDKLSVWQIPPAG